MLRMSALFDWVVELITQTSTDLPPDVRAAMNARPARRGARAPGRR